MIYKSAKVQVLSEKYCIIVIFSDYEQTNDLSRNFTTSSNEIIFILFYSLYRFVSTNNFVILL